MSRSTTDGDGNGNEAGDAGDLPGERPPLSEWDPVPLAVGTLVAVAGALFLAQPLGPVWLAGRPLQPMVLSTAALTAGFGLGAVVYLRRGRRLVGLAHAVGAVGWGLVVVAAGLGSVAVLFGGFAVVVGGAVALVAESRHLR